MFLVIALLVVVSSSILFLRLLLTSFILSMLDSLKFNSDLNFLIFDSYSAVALLKSVINV